MVRGIEFFQEYFQEYRDCYLLIGGAACDLVMSEAGVPFRATKDLDIVLCVEALTSDFSQAFWSFISKGGYELIERADGSRLLYRFQKPSSEDYPYMLELFSREPDVLKVAEGSHLTPLPIGEDASSLSAILMDDDYYQFLHSGRQTISGVSLVGSEHLIVLKARAWLDMRARKEAGGQVDKRHIKKHKNDIFRLYQIIDPDFSTTIPTTIKEDLREFIQQMKNEPLDMKSLGLAGTTKSSILEEFERLFQLAR